MFQSYAFQSYGFQVVVGQTATTGGGFVYPYEKLRDEQYEREKLRKQKSELEKLDSVLKEAQRKAALAEESKRIAQEKEDKRNAKRLANLEQELLNEITRLLMVRAEIVARIRRSEEQLILMIAMKRKRLRAITWRAQKPLAII